MEEKKVKHFAFTNKDMENLEVVRKATDCISNNETVRTALRLAAEHYGGDKE